MNCTHHPACPGCPLAGAPYAEQLLQKRERLQRAFAGYPHLPPVPPVRGSAWEEGYRHRLKLPVQVQNGRVAIGLYDRRGQNVVDTPSCPVLEPELRAALGVIRRWLSGKRDVHSVDLRRSHATGQLQLVLATPSGDIKGGKSALTALTAQLPALASIAISRADPERKRVMGASPQLAWGVPMLTERIGHTEYRIHPGAFFQTDPRQAEVLHDLVRRAVGDAQTVLDLYAGVGAYALMLAPGRQRVLAVEEVPQAARSAAELAPRNVQVTTSRVEDLPLRDPFDVCVLNPARRGSDPGVLARLARLARRLIYVSCGPETLARDLDILAFHGMRVAEVAPIDLFPQTPEVETVVTLVPGPPLRTWPIGRGGTAQSPWGGEPSGVVGRPEWVTVLALGDTGPSGELPGGRFQRVRTLATHSLLRLHLRGPVAPALAALSRGGHPIAGADPRTARFFAEKAGLLRPFVHVDAAGGAEAPLHGDLQAALAALADAPSGAPRSTGGRSGSGAPRSPSRFGPRRKNPRRP